MASSLADLYVELSLKNEKFTRGLEESAAAGEAFGAKYSSAAKDAQDASKKLADQEKATADEASRSAGAWSRLAGKLQSARSEMLKLIGLGGGGKNGGILGKIWGSLPGGGASGSGLGVLGNLSGLAAGGAGIAAGIGALLVEIDGLASGFAAAGAGAGAFALLAMPAFHAVSGAYTKIHTDQLAYNNALTATAKNTALAHLKQDYANLDPAERGALRGIQQLMGTYHRMSKAFEGPAFKVFNDALKIANKLLPDVTPFARTFANALDGLLQKVAKFAGSKGFKDWLDQFRKLEGPSITAIGTGIGKVAIAVGKLLTIMSSKDVVNAINIAFTILAGTIDALGFVIKRIMLRWDQWQQAFRQTRRAVAEVGHDIATWFDRIRHAVAVAMDAVAQRVDQDVHRVTSSVHRWYGDLMQAVSWFRALPGRILAALKALPGEMLSVGENIVRGLIHGLTNMIGAAVNAAKSVGSSILSGVKGLFGISSPSTVMRTIGLQLAQGLILGLEGSASQVRSAASKLASDVKAALSAKMIGYGEASSLTSFIQRDNTRLQKLANERTSILKEIAAAKKYATSTAQAAEQQYGVVNAAGGGTAPATAASILATLRTNLTSIRAFKSNIQKLARMGLNKAYIAQIIAAGPVDGGQIAQELASGSWSQIQQINTVEKQITSASTSLGKTAADAMYDSGKQAGRGFLTGLEHQQKSIEDVMKRIARAMVATIRKELGIRSPSTVMHQHGLDAARGFALGIQDGIAETTAVSARLAGAVSAGAHGGGAGGGGTVIHLEPHITVQGYIGDQEQLVSKLLPPLQKMVLEVDRINPGTGNGLSLGTAAGRIS